jgi:sensor histidine kinase YesM
MEFLGKTMQLARIQWLVWIMVFIINFLSFLPLDGAPQAIMYSTVNNLFYAAIIYGNIHILFPKYFKKGFFFQYGLTSGTFLLSAGTVKAYLISFINSRYFTSTASPITMAKIAYHIAGGALAFVLSFVFRMVFSYFDLKQKTRDILASKNQAELQLLRSRVQPHFLFNTLNNIYYEVFVEAPRGALLIGMLSEIMRYFVEESQKPEVSLDTEVLFLENYIALEKVRIKHAIHVAFKKNYREGARIPPMLLMPFVENIFKHGVDRSEDGNDILISLEQKERYLFFVTENNCRKDMPPIGKNGFGIRNLRERLSLLYANDFELRVWSAGNSFHSLLKIPEQ